MSVPSSSSSQPSTLIFPPVTSSSSSSSSLLNHVGPLLIIPTIQGKEQLGNIAQIVQIDFDSIEEASIRLQQFQLSLKIHELSKKMMREEPPIGGKNESSSNSSLVEPKVINIGRGHHPTISSLNKDGTWTVTQRWKDGEKEPPLPEQPLGDSVPYLDGTTWFRETCCSVPARESRDPSGSTSEVPR